MRGKVGEKSKYLLDLRGKVFDRLTVKRWLGKGQWRCKCDCGKYTNVRVCHLMSGHTKSCGCLSSESRKQTKNVKHGFWNTRFSEGRMKFYLVWQNIKARCNNPKSKSYKHYGGRGIKYDPRWEEFDGFRKDMYFKYIYARKHLKMERLSIERIDVNEGYFKDNCTFIPLMDQLKNQRTTRPFIAVSPNGDTFEGKNVSEFCREYGLNSSHVYYCLDGKEKQHKGWKFRKP